MFPTSYRAKLLGVARVLDDLPTDALRLHAWELTEQRLHRQRAVAEQFATLVIVGVAFFGLPALIMAVSPVLVRRYVGLPVAGVSLLIALVAILWIQRRRHQIVLRQVLVDLGVLICPACGYNLRGQVAPRCPECGCGFDLLGGLVPDGPPLAASLAQFRAARSPSSDSTGETCMARTVTLKGNPLNVTGPQLKVGDKAPDATLKKDLLSDIKVSQTTGKTRIFSVVPSLDTPVCAMQTKRFNEEAAKLSNVEFYTVSFDLPVAQKRFCGAEGINPERMHTLSDHKDAAFSAAWGTLIPDLRISCRAVFVVDKTDTLRYVEYVPEIADQPNYDAVLAAAKAS